MRTNNTNNIFSKSSKWFRNKSELGAGIVLCIS